MLCRYEDQLQELRRKVASEASGISSHATADVQSLQRELLAARQVLNSGTVMHCGRSCSRHPESISSKAYAQWQQALVIIHACMQQQRL